ncbi:uncharacterized protein LOC125672084 isoform X3 [Ostrea edulis]|uniref:uncharacterized protein LOC125672084 isoform X3 n=1 Tax=Ostrea edulis TaxID=37623 RepID=UPI0024AF6B1B|nr:uncharacterized protein LOC125672084 isoform X3 [Ostrea edulis]
MASTERNADVGMAAKMQPVNFPIDLSNVPENVADVMKEIKKLAESMLFHWSVFPIVLPPSVTDLMDMENKDGESQIFKDLFKAPVFDELEEVGMTPDGGLKKLSKKQLDDIWDKGEFDVDSVNFIGQVHKWRLTQLLQKGSVRAHNSMLDDAAISLRLMIITARNRFISHFFSLSRSVRELGRGMWLILDILIGMPSTSPGDLQSKIQDEHMKHLVAELDIKPKYRSTLDKFCTYVKMMCEKLQSKNYQTAALRPPPVPYIYQTPGGQEIDLRLFNKDLINNCLPILSSILERGARGWHVQYRLKMMRDLQGQGLSNEEISQRVNDAIMKEYLDRVFSAISSNTELENLQPGIGLLLVSQAKSVIAMKKAVSNVKDKMATHKKQLITHLQQAYPVKSRIEAWVNEQIARFEDDFITQNLWSAHEEAITLCEQQGLNQTAYFLKRDLNFIKEREAVLVKELSKVRIPNKRYTFSTRIWLPKNYIVTKIEGTRQTVIPTKMVKMEPIRKKTPGNLSYNVDRDHRWMSSSRYPFWRWWNYLQRTWAWSWNSLFFLGVVVPWCSPISIRALFWVRPFVPDLQLSQVDGTLYPKESSKTLTYISRLRSLWQHVSDSRRKFEETPDRGFLGKSLTRHLNRIWNYFCKGAIGTVGLTLTFPVLCVVGSTLSIVAAVLVPAWMPVTTLLFHIAGILIFDFDSPADNNKFSILFEAVIYRILIMGCIQPVAALFTGSLFCPVAALGVSVFALARRSGRGIWDTMMYFLVIRSRGRVPITDSFVAKRIAGPGLAAHYFFQIKSEQALAALESKMELDELDIWRKNMEKKIESPTEKYQKFVDQCFGPFSAGLVATGVYSHLQRETQSLQKDLMVKVREREGKLYTGLMSNNSDKIKLPERELKITILQGAKMVEKFYMERVLPQINLTEEYFWERKMLEYRDWRGLTSKLFAEAFSKAFLIPLDESDNFFRLEVKHLNLSRYTDMLASGNCRDDLDLVTEVHSPNGDMVARAPSLDLNYFDPNKVIIYTTRHQLSRSRSKPWKPRRRSVTFDQLQIPLPLPHPAVIALSIYNREHEQSPNNLEDSYCRRIVKATKEVPYIDLSESMTEDEAEFDPSTPENGAEEDPSFLHIAQQERTFSEEDMARIQKNKPKECV